MFNLLAFIVGVSSVAILVAGSLSFLRNPAKKEHRRFFMFSLVLAIWMPINFYGSNVVSPSVTPLLVKLDLSLALFIPWAVIYFAVAFVRTNRFSKFAKKKYLAQSKVFLSLSLAANLLFALLVFQNLLVPISIENDKLLIGSTLQLGAYASVLMFYFVYLLSVLGGVYRKATAGKRKGLDLIWLGLFVAMLANIFTNLVFPTFIDTRAVVQQLNIFGYLGILFLVGCIYVAITSQKLFDIKLVLARSLAYGLMLASIGFVYAMIITFIGVAITNDKPSNQFIAVNILFTFIAALTFQYVRKYFTHLTSQIFFKESYDPQTVLNNLSNITTSTLELGNLSRHTILLLEDVMKSSYCAIVLVNGTDNRVFRSEKAPAGMSTGNSALTEALKPHQPILVEDIEHHEALKKHMHTNNIELAIPMYANSALVGYLAFGTKENGVAYSRQDTQLLEIAADSLAVAIQNALRFEEIQDFAVTLQAKVNEATRKLQKTNEKLKSLDETKDDFISMASHQLRTPLTSVKGYISMVLEEDAGKITPMQKEMLGQAFFSSQRMVYLIADLLNVSRLKTGKFIIDPAPVNLSRVIEEELIQLKETATARQLKLEFIKPKNFPDLMLDETKIRQVIMNFVDNAIYYTPAGGKIKVRLIDEPRNVELRVEDTGLGVPKSEQPHLFTKFYRAGNARKARPDGTGLGLFMAKKVIMAQGGSTIFESQEGKGSTFGFTFNKKHLNDMAAEIKNPHTTTTSTTRDQK